MTPPKQDTDAMTTPVTTRVHAFAGLRRDVEIGLAIAPTGDHAIAAASSLASFLDDEPAVPVRLAGLSTRGSRVIITLAVTLGSIDEVKVSGPQARAAVLLLQRLVDQFSAYDPAFALPPEADSVEARLAAHVALPTSPVTLAETVQRLVLAG